ncbi:hypothetical protein BU24DRAFT_282960 [Aaosphaeria arxii CBS 175.79]|uniref:Uncharacterized protein n=1 Tax=Aaosphaeria arxii CBS 175.79 TaxID=1450172 RepID=A0A6A5XEL7_9PLEO|nr:uncharacterized protein BU24DRAFT_282960 [Aaosphaeria arxii CBS 175.79]KAF2011522.1 hypothetical protein BU24DRAFT_282960 [Aaosphaeria arxii CBS 175.79]
MPAFASRNRPIQLNPFQFLYQTTNYPVPRYSPSVIHPLPRRYSFTSDSIDSPTRVNPSCQSITTTSTLYSILYTLHPTPAHSPTIFPILSRSTFPTLPIPTKGQLSRLPTNSNPFALLSTFIFTFHSPTSSPAVHHLHSTLLPTNHQTLRPSPHLLPSKAPHAVRATSDIRQTFHPQPNHLSLPLNIGRALLLGAAVRQPSAGATVAYTDDF